MIPMMRKTTDVMGSDIVRAIGTNCYAVCVCVIQVEDMLCHDGTQAYSVSACVWWVNPIGGEKWGFAKRWVNLM